MYRVRLDALLCMRMDLVYVRQLETTSQATAMARIAPSRNIGRDLTRLVDMRKISWDIVRTRTGCVRIALDVRWMCVGCA